MSPILGSRTMGPRGYGFAGAGTPQAPTIGTVTRTDNTTISIPFTAASDGGLAITSYVVTSSPSISLSVSGTSTPLTVTGLFVLNQSYTFQIAAVNAAGNSTYSSSSNPVTVALTPTVSGGTLYSDATYYYRVFTGTGNIVVANAAITADTLAVAGGGGGGLKITGGSGTGGGGGGGGVLLLTSQTIPAATTSVVVGGGGGASSQGSPSYVTGLTAAVGGGYGGNLNNAAMDGGPGGSGGGAQAWSAAASGGLGTAGQGNNGGGAGAGSYAACSGGGAGGAGSGTTFGPGTTAYNTAWLTPCSGSSLGFSGYVGAGGGSTGSSAQGAGGLINSNGSPGGGPSGQARSGGGGGIDANCSTGNGGSGGGGFVIVRYTRSQVGG